MLALLIAPATQGQDQTLLVNDAGVGRLNMQTPYAVEAVSEALGGLPVRATTVYFGNVATPVLEAIRDGKRALVVCCEHLRVLTYGSPPESPPRGKRVVYAVIYAAEIATSTGVTIGTPMARVFTELPNPRCLNGVEGQADLIWCPAPDLKNVGLVFRCNNTSRDNSMPPVDVLARCPVDHIIWSAPG